MMNIRQIVRLRQLLRRWQTRAHRRRRDSSPLSTVTVTVTSCMRSPRAADRRRARAFSDADETDDDDDEHSVSFRRPATPPADVPEGYLAVYVGMTDGERRRYVIPMWHLNRPSFRELLDRAAEEFGFEHAGGLTIPVDVATFESILVDESPMPVPVPVPVTAGRSRRRALEPLRRHRAAVSA